MIPSSHCIPILSVVLTCGILFECANASITLDDINAIDLYAYTFDRQTYEMGGGAGSSQTTTTLPTSLNPTLYAQAFHGPAKSDNSVNFATNGSQMVITVDVDLARGGVASREGSIAHFNNIGHPQVEFTITTDTPFTISGWFEVNGSVEGLGNSYFGSSLSDYPTPPAFSYYASANDTKDVSYNLNQSADSLTGTLSPGTYVWDFFAGIRTSATSDDGAEGKGQFQLVLGDASDPGVVPEPVSMLTWCGLALTAYWGKTSRRRRA